MTVSEFINKVGFKVKNEDVKKVNDTISGIKNTATKLLGALGIGFSLAKINQIAEEFNGINDKINYAVENSEDMLDTQQMILEAANRCKASYGNMASTIVSLKQANKDIFPLEDATRFVEYVNKLGLSAGYSEGEISSMQSSLQRVAASGVAGIGDINRMARSTPALVEKICEGLGVTREELNEMAASGKLTAEVIKTSIMNSADSIDKSFNNLDFSISDAMQNIRNQWGYFVDGLNSSLGVTRTIAKTMVSGFQKVISVLTKVRTGLEWLAQKLGGTENLMKLFAIVAGAISVAFGFDKIKKGFSAITSFFGIGKAKLMVILGVIVVLALLVEDFINFIKGNNSLIGSFLEKAGIDVQAVRDRFREFWEQIKNVIGTVKELAKELGGKLLTSLGNLLSGVMTKFIAMLPKILALLEPLATLIGNLLSSALDVLFASLDSVIQIIGIFAETIIDILSDILPPLIDLINQILPLITGLVKKVLPLVVQIIKKIAPLIGELIKSILPPLIDLVNSLIPVLIEIIEAILPVIEDLLTELIPVVVEIVQAILPVIIDLIKSLLPAVKQIIMAIVPIIKSILPPLVDLIRTLIPVLVEIIQAIIPLIIDLLDELIPFVVQIIQDILPVVISLIQSLLPLVKKIITAILPIVIKLINTLLPVIIQIIEAVLPVIISLLEKLIPVAIQIIEAILPIIIQLLDAILPIISQIIDAYLPVILELIQAILPLVMTIIDGVLPILLEEINAIMPILQPIFDLMSSLVSSILPVIVTILQALTPIIEVISKVLEPVYKVIGAIVGAIGKIVGWVSKGLSWLISLFFGGGDDPKKTADSVNGYAEGTDYTEDTFVAGEEGPELITGQRGKKVFTAAATGNIMATLKAIAGSKTPSPKTVSNVSSVSNDKNIVQNVEINNEFHGDKGVQKEASKAMKKSADDVTSELARGLAFA